MIETSSSAQKQMSKVFNSGDDEKDDQAIVNHLVGALFGAFWAAEVHNFKNNGIGEGFEEECMWGAIGGAISAL